jgi:two-component system response regulator FixJ
LNARTVYIVDDNIDFLQSTEWWLQGAGFEVESFVNPHDALLALGTPRDGACLLLDVRMPQMSGLEVHDTLRRRGVNLPVIYMTGHGDVPLAVEAMRKGAVTFIEKPFGDEALEAALALAFTPPPPLAAAPFTPTTSGTGQAHAARTGTDAADTGEDSELSASQAEFAQRLAKLTPREEEVIGWVVKGKLNKVIADILGISIKTVELHRKNAMLKLQARSVIELTRLMVTRSVS